MQSLIAWVNRPGVVGIAITGSYSRGQQDAYSDVDLDIFVDELPKDSYTLKIFDEKLISLKYVKAQNEYDGLRNPQIAIWAVPGLSRLQIVMDERGEIAKLKQAALDFRWDDLQDAANEFAVEELMGNAEEAHKIMSGLVQKSESKVIYAAWGLFKNLAEAVAVQSGLMIETENHYLKTIMEHVGTDHPWTQAFRFAFGLDTKTDEPAWKTRGEATLELYQQTALRFKNLSWGKHQEVIENTLQLIDEFQLTNKRT